MTSTLFLPATLLQEAHRHADGPGEDLLLVRTRVCALARACVPARPRLPLHRLRHPMLSDSACLSQDGAPVAVRGDAGDMSAVLVEPLKRIQSQRCAWVHCAFGSAIFDTGAAGAK